jgi:hypothetical protein
METVLLPDLPPLLQAVRNGFVEVLFQPYTAPLIQCDLEKKYSRPIDERPDNPG